ncbi:heparinase II/III domain-containing protein [Leifsonia soli]|uniref:heparinase II/III domain-containing protein n=1 Tax=Leifsonia soli TaxID=582665 RepID=UPI0031CE72EE
MNRPPTAAEPHPDVLARVSAHTSPPDGVRATPFAGPLWQQWGDRMREPALRARFVRAGTEELRRRSGIPEAGDRSVWAAADPSTITTLRDAAEDDLRRPWADATATLFARFVRDGDRSQYERAVAARQQRLTRAVVLAASTREPEWIDEAADGAVLLCEQSTWCLPAHDDAHARRGFAVPDTAAPYLDLAAGEVVAQLAVADRVLGADWARSWPGLRERIRREAETRVFAPFETRDDLWWLGYWREVNNWNPWILGNVLLAAVLLLDDPERVARMSARALDSLDRYVATLPPDGAIDEGVAYWWNGAGRMLELLALIAQLTDGDLEAGGMPLIGEVLRFPMRMQLGDDWYVNVADGWARSRREEPWQLPFRWALRTGDHRVADWARGGRRPGSPVAPVTGGLPRLVRAVADREWRDAVAAGAPLPRCVWLPSVQVLVRRERAGDSSGLALAAKGGTNDENHNHKDLGSFIVASGGRPLLVDIGKPTYTRETFSADRYRIRAMQSGWHNAPSPHGLEQGEGPGFRARVAGAAPAGEPGGENADSAPPIDLELDLSTAYPLGADESWRRRFRFVSSRRIEVTDTWRLTSAADGSATALHLIAAGDVRLVDGRVVVRADGQGIAVRVEGEGAAPALEVWPLDDPELRAVWGPSLTRITYDLPWAAGTVTTVVEEIG